MVKFHKENYLSGAFLRSHCALREYEYCKTPCKLTSCDHMGRLHHDMNNRTLLGLLLPIKVLYGDVKLS